MLFEENDTPQKSAAVTNDAMQGVGVLKGHDDTSVRPHGTGGTPGSLLTTADFATIPCQCQIFNPTNILVL